MKKTILIGVVLLGIATVFVLYGSRNLASAPAPAETATSTTPSAVYANATVDDIVVISPQPGTEISGGVLTIAGSARGNWYFEASFPVEIVAENGITLAQFPIQAQGDWMTTDFVPFTEEVALGDYEGKVTVILHKDNPSGLPEHDASVAIPIIVTGGKAVPVVSSTSTPTAGADGIED